MGTVDYLFLVISVVVGVPIGFLVMVRLLTVWMGAPEEQPDGFWGKFLWMLSVLLEPIVRPFRPIWKKAPRWSYLDIEKGLQDKPVYLWAFSGALYMLVVGTMVSGLTLSHYVNLIQARPFFVFLFNSGYDQLILFLQKAGFCLVGLGFLKSGIDRARPGLYLGGFLLIGWFLLEVLRELDFSYFRLIFSTPASTYVKHGSDIGIVLHHAIGFIWGLAWLLIGYGCWNLKRPFKLGNILSLSAFATGIVTIGIELQNILRRTHVLTPYDMLNKANFQDITLMTGTIEFVLEAILMIVLVLWFGFARWGKGTGENRTRLDAV